MTYAEIIKKLKTKRNALGLTQSDLGDKIGLSKSHISNLETGTFTCPSFLLVKWAEALNCKISVID